MAKLTESQRRRIIVESGLTVAKRHGLVGTDYNEVAKGCSVDTSESTVRYYFRAKGNLWRAILKHPNCNATLRKEAVALGVI